MKQWQSLAGFGISLIFLYLVFFKPDLTNLFRGDRAFFDALFGSMRINVHDLQVALEMFRLVPAIVASGILILSLLLRSWRWQLMIKQVGPVRFSTVLWSNSLGYLLNNLLPFRIGEVIRAMIVARDSDLSKVTMVSVVILERILDMAGLVLLFGLVLAVYPFPYWLRLGGLLFSALVVLWLIICIILSSSHKKVINWIKIRIKDKPPIILHLGDGIINSIFGLRVLRKTGAMINVTWSSIVLWILYVSVMKFALDSFGFTTGLYSSIGTTGWLPAAVLTIMTTIGLAVPTAPGGIGTYHASALITLTWFQVPEAMGVVFVTTMHLYMNTTLNIMGLIAMWQLGLSWKLLMKKVKEEKVELTSSSGNDQKSFES